MIRVKLFSKTTGGGCCHCKGGSRIQGTLLTNEEIEEYSDLLLGLSDLRDYFDRQIYSTAVYLNCTLLTEDGRLYELFDSSKMESYKHPKAVLKWNGRIYESSIFLMNKCLLQKPLGKKWGAAFSS
jgi:hypothetical protein